MIESNAYSNPFKIFLGHKIRKLAYENEKCFDAHDD